MDSVKMIRLAGLKEVGHCLRTFDLLVDRELVGEEEEELLEVN